MFILTPDHFHPVQTTTVVICTQLPIRIFICLFTDVPFQYRLPGRMTSKVEKWTLLYRGTFSGGCECWRPLRTVFKIVLTTNDCLGNNSDFFLTPARPKSRTIRDKRLPPPLKSLIVFSPDWYRFINGFNLFCRVREGVSNINEYH